MGTNVCITLGLCTILFSTSEHKFLSGKPEPYDFLPATRDIQQYDGKIVECSLNSNGQWKIMRERTDKNKPNHVSTANAVMESIVNPVTEKMLVQTCHYNVVSVDMKNLNLAVK